MTHSRTTLQQHLSHIKLLRRWPGLLPVAGPLTVVLVIVTWVLLLATGFGPLYRVAFPVEFRARRLTRTPVEHNLSGDVHRPQA